MVCVCFCIFCYHIRRLLILNAMVTAIQFLKLIFTFLFFPSNSHKNPLLLLYCIYKLQTLSLSLTSIPKYVDTPHHHHHPLLLQIKHTLSSPFTLKSHSAPPTPHHHHHSPILPIRTTQSPLAAPISKPHRATPDSSCHCPTCPSSPPFAVWFLKNRQINSQLLLHWQIRIIFLIPLLKRHPSRQDWKV